MVQKVFILLSKSLSVFGPSTGNADSGIEPGRAEKVFWIPSFPDVRKGVALKTLQRGILESENIPWINKEKTIFPARRILGKAGEYLRSNLGLGKGTASLWAIHPGSGSPHKNWPLERFLETAEKLRDRYQVQPIFLTGSGGTGKPIDL